MTNGRKGKERVRLSGGEAAPALAYRQARVSAKDTDLALREIPRG